MVLNEQGFNNLLTNNPTRQYGIFNNTIYDFTDFFATALDGVPSHTPTTQNVTRELNTAGVSDAIQVATVQTFETNIFDILLAVGGPALWSVTIPAAPNDTYEPTIVYSNSDVRDILADPTQHPIPDMAPLYIARWRDTFYDITVPMNTIPGIVGNPRYTNDFPITLSDGGLGATPLSNSIVFNRVIEQDETSYADIAPGFIENPGNNPAGDPYNNGCTFAHDFEIGAFPDTMKFGHAGPVETMQGQSFQSNQMAAGIATAYSKDGTTMAFAERTIVADDNSAIRIKTYRFGANTWDQIGQVITTNTSISNGLIADNPNRIIDFSYNGQIMVIGDRDTFDPLPNPGKITIYEYNSGTNMWDIKGGNNPINGTISEQFGFDVAISGDGSHVIASYNEAAGTGTDMKAVRIYEFQSTAWVKIGADLHMDDNAAQGFGLAMSFDGSIVATGNPTSPSGNGVVIMYERTNPTTYVLKYANIIPASGNPVQFGMSVDLNDDGNVVVIGCPGSMRTLTNGSVEVYDDSGFSWDLVSNIIQGQRGDQFGFSVSISSDGRTIAASAKTGDLTSADSGYTQIYRLNLFPFIWDQIGKMVGISAASNLSIFSRISGSGRRLILGTPADTVNNGDVRIVTFDPQIQAFVNNYTIAGIGAVEGNFITDIGSRGTDNHPTGLALTVSEIDLGAGTQTIASLPSNTSNPGNGYEKEGVLVAGGGIAYFNSADLTGNFRFESSGMGNEPTFEYIVVQGAYDPQSSGARFLVTLVLDPIPSAGVYHNVNGGANYLFMNESGTMTAAGGVLPYTYGVDPPTIVPGGMVTVPDPATPAVPNSYAFTPVQLNVVGTNFYNFTLFVADDDIPVTKETEIFQVTYVVNPELIFNTPTAGSADRLVNDTIPPQNVMNETGQFDAFVSGGTPVMPGNEYDYDIVGVTSPAGPGEIQQLGTYGTLRIQTVSPGSYEYFLGEDLVTNYPNPIPIPLPNTIGAPSDTDTFMVSVADQTGDSKTVTYSFAYDVAAEFILNNPPNGSITRQNNNPNYFESNLSGNLVPLTSSGDPGSPPFTYSGSTTGSYGSLTVTPGGLYNYELIPADALDFEPVGFMAMENFTINSMDSQGRVVMANLVVTLAVTEGVAVNPVPDGFVTRSVEGPIVSTLQLTGNIVLVGGTAMSYGAANSTPGPGANEVFVENLAPIPPFSLGDILGRLIVNTVTGAYEYIPDTGMIGTDIDKYLDNFTLTATDTNSLMGSTPFTVEFKINPQLLIERLEPGGGSIKRNSNQSSGLFNSSGLTGVLAPTGGVPNPPPSPYEYEFGIVGGSVASSTVSSNGALGYGTMVIGRFNGEFTYNPVALPSAPGVTTDLFVFTVKDGNGVVKELNYPVTFTVDDTPLDLLPAFRDVQNRSFVRYWNRVLQRENVSSFAQIITIDSTEVLVIGQTKTLTVPDPKRDVDAILRQLLRTISFEQVDDIGDVLTHIKNDTKDALNTDDADGTSMYTFTFNNETLVTELTDVLSSQHPDFLLNRYRSNVGEATFVFYADDIVPTTVEDPLPPELQEIVNQIELLVQLGVRTIIGVMMDTGSSSELLETKQSSFLSYLRYGNPESVDDNEEPIRDGVAGDATIIPSVVRYDNTAPNDFSYVNVTYGNADDAPPIKFVLDIEGFGLTHTLQEALMGVDQVIRDENYNVNQGQLRIIITEVNGDRATGETLYGTYNSSLVQTNDNPSNYEFLASREFTDSTHLISTTMRPFLPQVGENQKQVIELTQKGSVSNNITELKPGDILYTTNRPTFIVPNKVQILMSVVFGVGIDPFIGEDIFMQIDDGIRYPNNPVFRGKVLSIDEQFKTDTLEKVTVDGKIMKDNTASFDYLITVDLLEPNTGGAGLEEYVSFPRLGFITMYFGRQSGTLIGIGPFARGAVTKILS
jgi:hypothetical protein